MKAIQLILTFVSTMLLASTAGLAQDERYGKTPEQQLKCKEALSVYKSYKKQKNYEEAYIQWRKACAVCPETASEGLYADGTSFIGKELKKLEDEDPRKAVLIDSLLYLHDKRMELYPSTKRSPNNRCEVLGRKASDFYKYNKNEHQQAYEMFKESIDCLKESSSATTLYQYYTASFYLPSEYWDTVTKYSVILTQWKTVDAPHGALRLSNYGDYKLYYAGAFGAEPDATDDGTYIGQATPDAWNDVKIYYKKSLGSDGQFRFYLNGVKVSSAELEAACNRAHDAVLETAAVGVPPPGGGPEKLHVFVVLKKGQEAPPLNKLKILFNKAMAQALGPGYYTEGVHAVDSLPRTASNKVMRRVLRDNLEKA